MPPPLNGEGQQPSHPLSRFETSRGPLEPTEAIERLIDIIEELLDEVENNTNASFGVIRFRLKELSEKL